MIRKLSQTGVMAGLVPAIHVFSLVTKDVDARAKRGHDGFNLISFRSDM
jgi:hypothetical protein